MKKLLSLLIVFSFLASTVSLSRICTAANFTAYNEGNYRVVVDYDTKILTVSGTGEMKNYTKNSPAPWINIRSAYTKIVIEPGITSVGDYCFQESPKLSSVSFSSTVARIGARAFSQCSVLSGTLLIPETVKEVGSGAFAGCRKLTEAVLPESLGEKIPSYIFSECTSLEKVEIQKNCKEIGAYAFYGCKSLKNASLPSGLEIIGDSSFSGCISFIEPVIPEGVKKIDWNAFYGISGISEINIPKSVEYIGYNAFYGTGWYASLPDGINILNGISLTFKGKVTDKTLEIPDGTRILSSKTLPGTSFVTEITIPDSVEVICDHALYNFLSLFSVTIPDSVKRIDDFALGYIETKELVESAQIPFTIYGHGGTEAERYAEANGFDFVCMHEAGGYLSRPDCSSGGEATVICRFCGEILGTEHIAPAEHKYSSVITRQASCTAGKCRYQICSECGSMRIISESPALGHDLPEHYTVGSYPSCTEDGILYKECLRCGEVCDTRRIEKTGHMPSDEMTVKKEPGCTEKGEGVITCIKCGDEIETLEIPPKGHSPTCKWRILSPSDPFTASPGLRAIECSECEYILEYEEFIAGDINSDGKVDTTDSVEMKRLIAGNAVLTRYEYMNADMNGDGKVNSADRIIFKMVLSR